MEHSFILWTRESTPLHQGCDFKNLPEIANALILRQDLDNANLETAAQRSQVQEQRQRTTYSEDV